MAKKNEKIVSMDEQDFADEVMNIYDDLELLIEAITDKDVETQKQVQDNISRDGLKHLLEWMNGKLILTVHA